MTDAVAAPPAARGVSLVIPNYNGRDLLRKNAPSWLAAARAWPGPSEVIVVDDASKDDSVAVLENELRDVRVVKHAVNQGFGGACGSGVAAAKHGLVVLLNSDVTCTDVGFLEPLLAPYARDPSVFAVAALVIDGDGSVYKNAVNLPRLRHGELRWEGVPSEDLLALATLPRERPLELRTLFPVGCAFALDRDRFLAIGGFDPLYRPFYHEDVDLGLAAWARGWKVLVEPRSRVVHAWGGTINRLYPSFRIRLASRRHRFLMSWKWARGGWLRKHLGYLFRRLITRWVRFDVVFYWGFLQALRRSGEARRARARVQAETTVGIERVLEDVRASWPPVELAEVRAAAAAVAKP